MRGKPQVPHRLLGAAPCVRPGTDELPRQLFDPLVRLRSLYFGGAEDVPWSAGGAAGLLAPFEHRFKGGTQNFTIALPGSWPRPPWMEQRCTKGSHFEGKAWVTCNFCGVKKDFEINGDGEGICRPDIKPADPKSSEYLANLKKSGY